MKIIHKRFDPRNSLYFGGPRRTPVRMSRNGKQSDRHPQNTGKMDSLESAPSVDTAKVSTFVLSPRIGLWNQPNAPTLNIVIIPWQKLGHTVLVFKSGSHLQVHY